MLKSISNIFRQKGINLSSIPNLERYASANKLILKEDDETRRVVFIGDSIVDDWAEEHPDFFLDNGFVGRGIAAQTSPQVLLRFQQDVVALEPELVLILIGTNDIGENTGKYDKELTLACIKSMADIAEAQGIQVVLASVLPVEKYSWNEKVKNAPKLIDALNKEIRTYATERGHTYLDLNEAMRTKEGAMGEGLALDGVHPTAEGYEIMKEITLLTIEELLEE